MSRLLPKHLGTVIAAAADVAIPLRKVRRLIFVYDIIAVLAKVLSAMKDQQKDLQQFLA